MDTMEDTVPTAMDTDTDLDTDTLENDQLSLKPKLNPQQKQMPNLKRMQYLAFYLGSLDTEVMEVTEVMVAMGDIEAMEAMEDMADVS
mgnify:CR=1 FL=1